MRRDIPGLLLTLYARPHTKFLTLPILVTLRRPQSTDGSTAQLLTSAWEMTVGEAEIAVLIGDGMSRREIARRRNVSEQTVNAQLKSIFAKAGVGREAALAARVRAIGA